ncbi:MAG TPA: hypothetical protein VGJ32_13215 [Solirubrobacteraceae bacterium]
MVRDATGDVGQGGLDLTRISVGRAPDGRIRATITMAAAWSPRALLADSGPPGSICVRTWLGGRRPSVSQPDYLVCATVGANNERLKAAVFHERAGQLPERVAPASATKPSARTAVLRFGQSALGRPAALRFAIETAPGGCQQLSCRDTAPDAPRSARLALR